MGALRRDKRTDLSQQRNQCRLTQKRWLTRHIGTGYYDDLLRTTVQHHIIGNIFLSYRKLFLNYRVTALTNIQYVVILNNRTDVVILTRHISERQQTVQPGNLIGVNLYLGDKLRQCLYQIRI